jgi:hypothetical protein
VGVSALLRLDESLRWNRAFPRVLVGVAFTTKTVFLAIDDPRVYREGAVFAAWLARFTRDVSLQG